jgi:serine/threonine protein phosphatase PrpC
MISSIFRFRSSTFSRSSRGVAGLLAFCVSVRTTALAPTTITLAEAAPYSKSFSTSTSKNNDNGSSNDKKHPNEGENGCLSYGRPLYPQDVYYNRKIKEALEKLRTLKRDDADTAINADLLVLSGEKYMAALTLIGYKGGSLESQINQDRAVVVSPFWVGNNEKEEDKQQQNNKRNKLSRLVGIFDGHARLGEIVSEYVVKELPILLATKLDKLKPRDDPEQIKTAITDTFIELDKTCPGEISGGCTASIILQRGSKLYVANAGDSRSFLVMYRANSQTTDVIYISREDKPSLPDEKKRVEQMGGQVFLPPFGTSRVLYTDPESGLTSGLAMSRSIGDWEVGKLGVIPDPIVDIVDIEQVVHDQLKNGDINDDDVYIFAVSATDGLMDYTTPEVVAQTVAASMYDKDGPHLLTALETQIYMSAAGWEKAKRGEYRDDIAISVSEIRIPPSLD